jgi:hypothetical protein
MKKLILILALGIPLIGFAQFTGTDSLRNYNNRFIDNNASKAFTNLRLHNLLSGIIDFIDSAGGGSTLALGTDTIFSTQDSIVHYRRGGVFRQFIVRGNPGAGNIYEIPFSDGFGRFGRDSNFLFDKSQGANNTRLIVGPTVINDGGLSKINSTSDNMNAMSLSSFGTGLNTIIFRRALGTVATPLAITQDADLWNFSGRGYTGTVYTGSRAAIYARAAQNWTDSTNGTALYFAITEKDSSVMKPRMAVKDSGVVIYDQSNGAQLIIGHKEGRVAFTKESVGKYSFDDSVEVNQVISGNENTGSLKLTSSSGTGKGLILFGDNSAFDERFHWLGLGNPVPDYAIDVIDSQNTATTLHIYDRSYSANAAPRVLLTNNVDQNAQFYLGSSTNAFAPNVFLIHSIASGGLKLVTTAGGPLVFGNNASQNTGEIMRLVPGTRNVLINTMTDDGTNKLQVNGPTSINGKLTLNNVTAPSGAYTVLVHDADSSIQQLPVSSLSTPNFFNADLAQTADRSHTSNGHNVTWDSIKNLNVISRGLSFKGTRRYFQIFDNPQSSQELNDFAWISSVMRNSDESGDSTYQRLTFNHNSGLRLENVNNAFSVHSSLTLNSISAELQSNEITMGTLPIATTGLDTVLIVKDFNTVRNTNKIYKAAVTDLGVGSAHTWAQTSPTTVSNTATETTMLGTGQGSLTITPGEWTVGKTFTLRFNGVLNTDGTNPGTSQFRVKLGSTELCSTQPIFQGTGTTDRYFDLEVTFTCLTVSSTGTITAQGKYTDGNAAINPMTNGGFTASVDMTTDQTFDVTLEWSQAATGNSATSNVVLFKSEN